LTNLHSKFILAAMKIPKEVRDFLAKIQSKGGKARAAKYDKKTLSKWGKKGGRPPKKGKKS
jgi:general stress protein YciG